MSSVLSIAYPLAPVGAASTGGAEQILSLLEGELVARGHTSLVAARDGSQIAGELFATAVPGEVFTDRLRASVTRLHQETIDRALSSRRVDLVHMHGFDFASYCIPAEIPVVVTLHLPPSSYPEQIWQLPANVHLVCVSDAQRQSCASFTDRPLAVIANGVRACVPSPSQRRRRFALMLSRICPEKNLHVGLDAARIAQTPALLAGETYPYPAHLDYRRTQIEPRLGSGARLLAPVGGEAKGRLLGRARCLLLPTLAPETSSLVAMEALHAGTPVVAFPSGAIPEIVEDGRTGFLVHDTLEMADAISRAGEIDPELCRATARQRFSLARMVDDYIALYDAVLSSPEPERVPRPQLNAPTPSSSRAESARETLRT